MPPMIFRNKKEADELVDNIISIFPAYAYDLAEGEYARPDYIVRQAEDGYEIYVCHHFLHGTRTIEDGPMTLEEVGEWNA